MTSGSPDPEPPDDATYDEAVRKWIRMYATGGKFRKKTLRAHPFPAAELLAEHAKGITWPKQVRSYVEGEGQCLGLTAGRKGASVHPQSAVLDGITKASP